MISLRMREQDRVDCGVVRRKHRAELREQLISVGAAVDQESAARGREDQRGVALSDIEEVDRETAVIRRGIEAGPNYGGCGGEEHCNDGRGGEVQAPRALPG